MEQSPDIGFKCYSKTLGVIKKLHWLNLQTHIYKWILDNLCSSHSGDLIFKHTPTIGFLTISTAPILAQSIANVYSAYGHSLLTGIGFYYGTMWTQEPKISFVFKHPPHFPGWPYLLLLCLSSVYSTSHTRTSEKIPEHPDLPCSNVGQDVSLPQTSFPYMHALFSLMTDLP